MNTPIKSVVTHADKAQARPTFREVAGLFAKIPAAIGRSLIGRDSFTQQVAKEAPKNKAIVEKYKQR